MCLSLLVRITQWLSLMSECIFKYMYLVILFGRINFVMDLSDIHPKMKEEHVQAKTKSRCAGKEWLM